MDKQIPSLCYGGDSFDSSSVHHLKVFPSSIYTQLFSPEKEQEINLSFSQILLEVLQ